MKQALSFLLTLLAFTGFTQVNQIDVKKAVVRNTIIYQGDTLAVVAVAHAASWDTLFVTKGSVLDTLIVSSVRELDNLSDVVLTTPDASDILMLDDETMKWVNYPFSNLIGDINDSLPNYWYLDGDTIKTIYNVVVDSSFVMKYKSNYIGYGDPFIGEDSIVTVSGFVNNTFFSSNQTGILNSVPTVNLAAVKNTNSSNLLIVPNFIEVTSDSIVIYELQEASSDYLVGWNSLTKQLVAADTALVTQLDGLTDVVLTNPDASDMLILDDETMKWVNRPLIQVYGDMLDTARKAPTTYDTWKKDTTNGYIIQADLTDKVGVGNTDADKQLDVNGTVQSSETQYNYRKHKAFLSFSSDDGKVTDYTVLYPLYESEGIKGTFNVITNSVGNSTYMTWAQILEMQASGHEIASHSASHRSLDTLTEAELVAEFDDAKGDFKAHGIFTTTLSYPYLASNRLVREIAQNYYRAGYGNATSGSNSHNFNQFCIQRIPLDTASVQEMKDSVLAAFNSNKYLTFYVHQVTTSAVDSIKKVIDYAQSLGMSIITHAQALDSVGNMIQVGDNFNVSQRGAKIDTVWGNPVFQNKTTFLGRIVQDYLTDNIAIGLDALKSIETGGELNVAVGRQAGELLQTGDYCTLVGYGAGGTNLTGSGLSAFGYHASSKSTVASTAFGYTALQNLTSGVGNTAFGYNSSSTGTTFQYNTAVGHASMQRNTGNGNSAFGYYALAGGATSSGAGNAAFGYQSNEDNSTGNYNASFGYRALGDLTSGNNNTAVGTRALHGVTTSSNATAIGYYAGYNCNNGYGIFLGYRAGYNETGSYKTYIAADSTSWANGMASGSKLLMYADMSNAAKSNHFINFFGKVSIGAAKNPTEMLSVTGNAAITGSLKSGTGSIADNDTSPSVANYNTFIYAGSANPVSIDALDDHVVGCYYTIIGNSNTYTITVIDGTPAGGDSFNLAGGNWVGGSQDVLLLYCIAADAFIEVSRSDN